MVIQFRKRHAFWLISKISPYTIALPRSLGTCCLNIYTTPRIKRCLHKCIRTEREQPANKKGARYALGNVCLWYSTLVRITPETDWPDRRALESLCRLINRHRITRDRLPTTAASSLQPGRRLFRDQCCTINLIVVP